ncbi:SAUR family protein [Vigna unguiculata]|uniref:SAUR family protein n=2 Tax=Vigna unguiculata TaxID=3917 RepID=A0A4D6L910_VIGUN|nr:SAUR family protein [Vigna unguiculata]
MEFVKKWKRVLGRSKRLYPENNLSGSYGRLRNKERQQRRKNNSKACVAPQGCLCVYVGAERERFVIKIEIANHPLFKELLDGAEREYGYRNDGPLCLPCHVDFFCEALTEMEIGTTVEEGVMGSHGYSHHNSCSVSNLSYATGSFSDRYYENLVN